MGISLCVPERTESLPNPVQGTNAPKETGLISFDTLRYLHHVKKSVSVETCQALFDLALSERYYLTRLIDQVSSQPLIESHVKVKAFVDALTQIMDRLEIYLLKKVLQVYILTHQDNKVEAIKNKRLVVRSRIGFIGDPESFVNPKFLDRLRLHSAWLRELANITIKCTSVNTDLLINYEQEFANMEIAQEQVINRALASLSPPPGEEAIIEWTAHSKQLL